MYIHELISLARRWYSIHVCNTVHVYVHVIILHYMHGCLLSITSKVALMNRISFSLYILNMYITHSIYLLLCARDRCCSSLLSLDCVQGSLFFFPIRELKFCPCSNDCYLLYIILSSLWGVCAVWTTNCDANEMEVGKNWCYKMHCSKVGLWTFNIFTHMRLAANIYIYVWKHALETMHYSRILIISATV